MKSKKNKIAILFLVLILAACSAAINIFSEQDEVIFGADNRIVVPASFFVGASYLVLCDTLARTLTAPSEIPVGAVTAILGAPIFIYLLRKRFNIF